jgi:hypothetical protein
MAEGVALRVYVPALSRQQSAHAPKVAGVPQKAIFENAILRFFDDITLAGDNRGDRIGKILKELDHQAHGSGDDPSLREAARAIGPPP